MFSVTFFTTVSKSRHVLYNCRMNIDGNLVNIFVHVVGWAGSALVVGAFALVSSKKVASDSRTYQWMNLLGAVGVGINAAYYSAWPSFAIQIVWGIIAIIALVNIWRTVGGKTKKRKK